MRATKVLVDDFDAYNVKVSLQSIPAADVAPVRYGRWERTDGNPYPSCSACGCESLSRADRPYCQFCGARMNPPEPPKYEAVEPPETNGPTVYELQILANQVTIMGALAVIFPEKGDMEILQNMLLCAENTRKLVLGVMPKEEA